MKKSLSILSANTLFLLTMVLVITVGSVIQSINMSSGLIATELFLIMLPTLVFLRIKKIPFKTGLRLNPIRPFLAVICVLLGLAIFIFSLFIEIIMAQLTCMASVPLAAGSLPKAGLESILYFVALAVFAPLCEEILFRGAIQGAYENQRSAAYAIIITGLMFAFNHFRLSGLPALLPVTFILGYVAWRTRSIFATMLVHFGMNAGSSANTLIALQVNGTGLPVTSIGAVLAAIAITAGLLYAITRLAPDPLTQYSLETAAVPTAKGLQPARRSWFRNYWPLALSGLLYLLVAGATLAVTVFPDLTASTKIAYFPPRIDQTTVSHYQITNRVGQVVGDLTCLLAPRGETFGLSCTRNILAYEVKTSSSYFSDITHKATWQASWNSKTLDLVGYSFERSAPDGSGYSATLQGGQLVVTSPEGADRVELAKNALVEYEWPWRVRMLDASGGSNFKVPFINLLRWDQEKSKSIPSLTIQLLSQHPLEKLNLPAGTFDAWKVIVAGQAAWYAADDSGFPRPVQFDDGMVIYSLDN